MFRSAMLVGLRGAMVLLTMSLPIVSADDPPAGLPLQRFTEEARGYAMTRDGQPLEWSSKAILHWGNPARNGEDGVFYVWMHAGRPEVIGSIFTYRRASTGRIVLKHTLHSVSESPLSAKYNDTMVWAPKLPGVKFTPILGADPPAATPQCASSKPDRWPESLRPTLPT
jgi:hypothetical protein